MSNSNSNSIENTILTSLRDVPDFPKKGIIFKDITPILSNPIIFDQTLTALAELLKPLNLTHIAGIEARGFIFGAPLARELKLPFVPIRKPGKLPWKKQSISYTLEYGSATIEIHEDALGDNPENSRVAMIDDLLATGGTTKAACQLIKAIGGKVVVAAFIVELGFLNGKNVLIDEVTEIKSLASVK
jgi:adenine phosphoribosyltransferase